jgi:sortase A
MKFRIKWQIFFPARTNSFLPWSRYLFFIIGIFLLSYVGLALLDARLYQADQTRRFEQALEELRPVTGSGVRLHPSPLPSAMAGADRARAESLGMVGREGSPLGRLEISRIGLTAMILEGIEEGTLRRAVGHIPGTPLPGQHGNVALAGHRDTFFRGLRKIRKDDEITLTTLSGSYRYRVDSTIVVEPEEIEVIGDADNDILTLVTCYPFNFVGAAPKRFIVRAHRVSGSSKPYSLPEFLLFESEPRLFRGNMPGTPRIIIAKTIGDSLSR